MPQQLSLRLPKRARKSRAGDDLAPGSVVIYHNRPMRVIRTGIAFGQLHVWIVDRDSDGLRLDETLRVPANQVELD